MTYEELLRKIYNKEPFSFSRFGDGEFNAIFQDRKSRMNCDAHQYFPDMGKRLLQVLESKPDYYIGLQSMAYRQRTEQIDELTECLGLEWCESNIIHRANIKGRLPELFDALKTRDVLLIGPSHLKKLKQFDFYICEIPIKDCWLKYEYVYEEIKALANVKDWVVVYAASMMTNILIDDFKNAGITQIDVGSALDPYCGVKSRSYHKTLKV